MSTEPVSTKTKSKKRIANKKPENSQTSEDKNLVFCSLCAEHISNYIPEYFCGEKYNPACERCKANDSSWAPDDPFASFPSETLPSSLVSHFFLHHICISNFTFFILHLLLCIVNTSTSSNKWKIFLQHCFKYFYVILMFFLYCSLIPNPTLYICTIWFLFLILFFCIVIYLIISIFLYMVFKYFYSISFILYCFPPRHYLYFYFFLLSFFFYFSVRYIPTNPTYVLI